MNNDLERINKLIDTPFDRINPVNYDEVITELQVRLRKAEKDKELLLLIKEDLLMRAEFDTEDGGAIVNLSGFIYDRSNQTIEEYKGKE